MAEEYRGWLSGPPSLGQQFTGYDSGGSAVYTDITDTTWSPPKDLPTTKYGSYTDVHPYDVPSSRGVGGFELINHDLWYNDPNYGPITPKWNTIDPSSLKNGYDYIGPAFAAILGTAVGIPWYATMGLSAAKAVGGADRENPMVGEFQQYQAGAAGLSPSSPSSTVAPAADTTDLNSLLFNSPTLDLLSSSPSSTETKKEQPVEELKQPTTADVSNLYDSLQASTKRLVTLYSFLSSDKKLV